MQYIGFDVRGWPLSPIFSDKLESQIIINFHSVYTYNI
jgi:hypothetical protein